MRKFWRRRCFHPGNNAWFPQVIFRDSCITSCIFEHWRWWYRWPIYSSRGSASFLNCDLFVILYIFQVWIYFILANIKCLESPSPFNNAFMGKICLTWSSLNYHCHLRSMSIPCSTWWRSDWPHKLIMIEKFIDNTNWSSQPSHTHTHTHTNNICDLTRGFGFYDKLKFSCNKFV